MFDVEFLEGDAQAGVAPTPLTAKRLNTFVEELLAILVDAGVTPDENDNGQVLESLHDLFLSPGEGAVLIDVEDLGGYYTGDDVETVLQEVGVKLAAGEFPTGTRMLFQQAAAPTGWTKETGAAYNKAMVAGVTGTPGTGGSNDPTAAHTHTIAHTHSTPHHHHQGEDATWSIIAGSAGGSGTISGVVNPGTTTITKGSFVIPTSGGGTTGSSSAANSGTWAPKYFEVIVATKD